MVTRGRSRGEEGFKVEMGSFMYNRRRRHWREVGVGSEGDRVRSDSS